MVCHAEGVDAAVAAIAAQTMRKAPDSEPRKRGEDLERWLIRESDRLGPVFRDVTTGAFVLFGPSAIANAFHSGSVTRVPDAVANAFFWGETPPLQLTSNLADRSRRRKAVAQALQRCVEAPAFMAALASASQAWATGCLSAGRVSLNAECFTHVGVELGLLLLDGRFDASRYSVADVARDLHEAAQRLVTLEQFRSGGVTDVLERLVDQAAERASSQPCVGFVSALLADAAAALTRDEVLNEAAHLLASLANSAPGILCGALNFLENNPELLEQSRVASRRFLCALNSADDPTEVWALLAADNVLFRVVCESARLYAKPVTAVGRAKTNLEVAGVLIPQGSLVMATFKSGGLDVAHFAQPNVFRVDRAPADSPRVLCPFAGGAFGSTASLSATRCLFERGAKLVLMASLAAFVSKCSWRRLNDDETVSAGGFGIWDYHVDIVATQPSDPLLNEAKQPEPESEAEPEEQEGQQRRRFAVIGAGIAGIVAARELQQLGHDVIIFDSQDEVAPSSATVRDTTFGKCSVLEADGFEYNMGAHILLPDGPVVRLAKSLNCAVDPFPPHQIFDVGAGRLDSRRGILSQQAAAFRELCETSAMAARPASMAGSMEMAASVGDYLHAHGIDELRSDVGAFFSAAGYGVLRDDYDKIPAAYLVKFALMIGATSKERHGAELRHGFGDLLRKASVGLDIRKGRACRSIVQVFPQGAKGPGPGSASCRLQVVLEPSRDQGEVASDPELFDGVVLACGAGARHLLEGDEAFCRQRKLLQHVKTNRYCTVLMRIDGLPRSGGVFVPRETQFGHVSAIVHTNVKNNIYQVCGYESPGQSLTELRAAMVAELEQCGTVRVVEVLGEREWDMFPHFDSMELADDVYGRLDALQGANNLWVAGSLATFELTDAIVDHSMQLAGRMHHTGAEATAVSSYLSACDVASPEAKTIVTVFLQRLREDHGASLYSFCDAAGNKGVMTKPQTVGEVAFRAIAVRSQLVRLGVLKGDRVGLVFPPDSDEFAFALWGCLLAGAIAVPLAPAKTYGQGDDASRLLAAFDDAGVKVALTNSRYKLLASVGRIADAALGALAWVSRADSPSKAATSVTYVTVADCRKDLVVGAELDSALTLLDSFVREIKPDDVAYLQYSSGTTSAPKGVVVTHDMLMHNLQTLLRCVDCVQTSLSWVPWWHDFGLVAGFFLPVLAASHYVAMSPLAFIRDPVRILQAIHTYRPDAVAMPCFGLRVLLDKVPLERAAGLDLSSIRSLALGGEPSNPQTLRAFARRFAQHNGFRPSSYANNYGAAECTLYICGGRPGSACVRTFDIDSLEQSARATMRDDVGPSAVKLASSTEGEGRTAEIVSCGPLKDSRKHGIVVRIVNPLSCTLCPDRTIGEVWVSSPSAARAYWGKPADDNERRLRATVRAERDAAFDSSQPLRFVRTGDTGFVYNGELFLRGRMANMIIQCGKNVHAEDVERACQDSHPSVRAGRIVAFAAPGERLVVVAEVKSRQAATGDVLRAIQAKVAAVLGLRCSVLLAAPGSLLKTTSGKLRPGAARQAVEDGKMEIWARADVAEATSVDPSTGSGDPRLGSRLRRMNLPAAPPKTGDLVTRAAAIKLAIEALVEPLFSHGGSQIGVAEAPFRMEPDAHLADFGLSSIDMMALVESLGRWLGREISPALFLVDRTIAELAEALAVEMDSSTDEDREASARLLLLCSGEQQSCVDAVNIFAIHPAGGDVGCYAALARFVCKEVPTARFYAIEAPNCALSLHKRAEQYADMIRQVQPTGPYFFVCYSMGAIFAQLALQDHLRAEAAKDDSRNDQTPSTIVMVESPAPVYKVGAALPKLRLSAFQDAAGMGIFNADRLRAIQEQTVFDIASFVEGNVDFMAQCNWNTVLLRGSLDDDPLRIANAPGDASNVRDQLQHPFYEDEDFGWRELLPADRLLVEHIPGDHFSVLAPWNLESVTKRLTPHLQEFVSRGRRVG